MPSQDQLVKLSEELFQAWNNHDVDAVLAKLTDDVIWVTPVGEMKGKAEAAADMKETFAAFGDLRFDRDAFEVFCNTDDSAVLTPWCASGTMTGGLRGLPATHRGGTVRGTTLVRLRGDLICEHTIVYDQLELMHQMGLMPGPNSLAFKALLLTDAVVTKATDAVRRH